MELSLGNPELGSTARIEDDPARLLEKVCALRVLEKRIVLTQGTFDLIHVGHAKYLAAAKAHGDILIVGVDGDEKVRARKGPNRPVVPETERTEMLCYLSSVDLVIIKGKDDARWALIDLVKPDVLIATSETYSDSELEQLKTICGEVVVLDPMSETSTSAKIRKTQIDFAETITRSLTQSLTQAVPEIVHTTVTDVLDGSRREETTS